MIYLDYGATSFHKPPQVYRAAERAMEKLVAAGKIFEVNTGAISRGYRTTPYPSAQWLRLLREMGGRVTVSADAHHKSGVTCAFDLAEKYRMPVLFLADGIMAQMMEPVEMPEMVDFKVDPEKKPWAATGWKPGDDPAKRAVINSLYINTEELTVHNNELQATYREIEKNEVLYEAYMCEDADYVITAFGTVARIAKSAINELRAQGIKVGLFRPITVWPFPYKELAEAAKNAKALLDVEANEGQMLQDVKLAINGAKPVEYFGHCGSLMPTTDEIVAKILEMKEGK